MKILVSDYDNTFYRNDREINLNIMKLKEFMKKDLFVIATGRSYMDFETKRNLYHIPYHYLILNHGATIIKNNKVIYNKCIEDNIKEKLLYDLQLKKTINSFGCSLLESRLPLTHHNLTKIFVMYETKEDCNSIYNNIKNKYQMINAYIVCGERAIEIVNDQVNKANSIKVIADLEKINKENIYTIGDSYTDLEMIKTYNGYAMKNGIDVIKKYAKKEYNAVYELINDIKDF